MGRLQVTGSMNKPGGGCHTLTALRRKVCLVYRAWSLAHLAAEDRGQGVALGPGLALPN